VSFRGKKIRVGIRKKNITAEKSWKCTEWIHPMNPLRITFRFFLWCAITPILLFGIFELLVRLLLPAIQPQGTDKILYAENRYGDTHGLMPCSVGRSNGALVHVDKNGFRGTFMPMDTSKVSWLLLGDSVTMGIGVEEDSTFAGLLQSRFPGVNILNPSMIGYHVRDYCNVLHRFVIERKNDLKIRRVFLFWCLNDLYMAKNAVEMPGGKIRLRIGKALNVLRVHSRFYYFLKTILFDRPKSYFLFDSRIYAEDRQKVADGIDRLEDIKRFCRSWRHRGWRTPNQNLQDSMEFMVVLLPYEYQLRSRNSDLNEPQRIMRVEMEDHGIEVSDPLPYLKASGIDSKVLYLYGDGIHLSTTGHRMVADFLWQTLHQGR
jgi:hypothetical protein